jgi:hypothetical protein
VDISSPFWRKAPSSSTVRGRIKMLFFPNPEPPIKIQEQVVYSYAKAIVG